MAERPFSDMAERIKKRRLELKLSLQDVADMTGLSKSTLQRYETGSIKNIPLQRLDAFASALKTTPEWIMGGDNWYQDLVKMLMGGDGEQPFPVRLPSQEALLAEFDSTTTLPIDFVHNAWNKAFLTADEVSLITAYRAFTTSGKEKIKAYMEDLSDNPKYSTRFHDTET